MKQADSKRDEMRARLGDIQAARQRMFEAMRADPFDRRRSKSAYADVRTRTNELQQAGQEIMLDAVANAPPDVRSQIRPPRGPFP